MVDISKNVGDSITARLMVNNTGTATGTWTISFAIEGTVGYGSDDYRVVTLAPGETLPIEWTFITPDKDSTSGQYVIYWDTGVVYYPAVLTQYIGTSYNLIISGIPVLQITNAEIL